MASLRDRIRDRIELCVTDIFHMLAAEVTAAIIPPTPLTDRIYARNAMEERSADPPAE